MTKTIFLPPEIVEKILVIVLENSSTPRDFFRCREVCSTWKSCADSILVHLDKRVTSLPRVLLNENPDFFSDFMTPLHQDEEQEEECINSSASILRFQLYWLNSLSLRSDIKLLVRPCRAVTNLTALKVACLSSHFVFASDANKVVVFDIDCDMDLVAIVEGCSNLTAIQQMKLVYDDTGQREFLVCMHINRKLSVVDVTTLCHLRFLEEFAAPGKVQQSQVKEQYVSIRFELFTRVYKYIVLTHEDCTDKTQLGNLKYDWFVEENGDSVYQNLSKLDGPRDFKRIWAFQSGTVVLKIDRDTEELLLVVNKPPVNNNEYPTELARQIYEPLSAYNGGVVTAAIFTCNALIVGTDNGRLYGYCVGGDLKSLAQLNLRKPDFRYRHSMAKPVISIAVTKMNHRGVQILVHHPDTLQIIERLLPC